MKFSRLDYQESIIDLRTENGLPGGIPADEPVFILRARDPAGAAAIISWVFEARRRGASEKIIASAMDQGQAMQRYAVEHGGFKTPTLPGEKS